MHSRLALTAAIYALAAAFHAEADPPALPALAPADGIGVSLHGLHPPPGELEMIRAAGCTWVRTDMAWDRTEKQKGVYDFSAYDAFLAALDHEKLRALFILDYGNPLYANPGDKHPFTSLGGTQAFRDAFAQWAVAAVKHFAGRGCIWETWNEPNYKGSWAPEPNIGDYAALVKTTADALKIAAPNEPLIGPASSQTDLKFLEACFQAGLLEDWSAVSVHPYRHGDPASVAADYRRLKHLIAQYAPAGKSIPIVCSEWGYSTQWNGIDESKQAEYDCGILMDDLANGIPISILYDWRDDGMDPANQEDHFGLVRNAYHAGRTPPFDTKPVYEALKAFTDRLTATPAGAKRD